MIRSHCRVAWPTSATSTPVANGSKVPACPTLVPRGRRCLSAFNAFAEETPAGLSMTRKPPGLSAVACISWMNGTRRQRRLDAHLAAGRLLLRARLIEIRKQPDQRHHNGFTVGQRIEQHADGDRLKVRLTAQEDPAPGVGSARALIAKNPLRRRQLGGGHVAAYLRSAGRGCLAGWRQLHVHFEEEAIAAPVLLQRLRRVVAEQAGAHVVAGALQPQPRRRKLVRLAVDADVNRDGGPLISLIIH